MKPEIENGTTYYEALWWRNQKNVYKLLRNFSVLMTLGYGTYIASEALNGHTYPSQMCCLSSMAVLSGAITVMSFAKFSAERKIEKTSNMIRQAHEEGQLLNMDPNDEYEIGRYIDAKKRVEENLKKD